MAAELLAWSVPHGCCHRESGFGMILWPSDAQGRWCSSTSSLSNFAFTYLPSSLG